MRRIDLILNVIFLIAIVALGYLLTTAGSNRDSEIDTGMASRLEDGGENAAGSETDYDNMAETDYGIGSFPETPFLVPIIPPQEDLFVNLLKRNVFTTIIPTPTPTPTPTPRPVVPAPLADVIKTWKLRMILGDEAHIEDTQNKGDLIIMKAVEAGGTPIKKSYKGVNFQIWAVEVNDMDYKVKLECDQHPKKYHTLAFGSK